MAHINVDKKSYEAKEGKNLLETCLTLGFNLPYFCWHPAMGSVGACRQCAVKLFKDENDTQGRLVMACMESIRDNMYVSVEDPVAKAFRSQNIEWLMTNHPHDCAVCDEGGSCHLQDMTVMTGHAYRRFAFKKRTYKNQYLGPFINHEMNRCIQCYRCVRFYKDYAGGKDLDVFGAHNHVYFGREKDGVLDNEFSGNLAEICPTGVFTDKTLKEHYTRKWDMTMAPSICQHCSVGCNTIAGERYGKLRQITSRFNSEVNGYFICDRGRFGYEFVNSLTRIQHPVIRGEKMGFGEKRNLYDNLKMFFAKQNIIGIGSPRASLEANYALRKLVGEEHFYQGVVENQAAMLRVMLSTLNSGYIHSPSIQEIEQADAVLILGEDPTHTAPRIALALRQAVRRKPLEQAQDIKIPAWHDAALRELIQDEKGDMFIAFPIGTKLDELGSDLFFGSPDEIAAFGFAIANYLSNDISKPDGLNEIKIKRARHIGEILKNAEHPLIVSGTSLCHEGIVRAACNIALALGLQKKTASLSVIVPECNSMGLAMMQAPALDEVWALGREGKVDAAIIIENDLYCRASKVDVDHFLDSCAQVMVMDHLHHATSSQASFVIPVATFAEGDGTMVNNEGRAQRYFQVFMPKNEDIRDSWLWLDEFNQFKNGTSPKDLKEPDNLIEELVVVMPQFKGAETVAPPADFRINGQKIPREPHRYSGRTAMLANVAVSEVKPPQDEDSPLSFTMEGFRGLPPAPLIPFFWSPGWNSVQSINKYQIEVGGPLHGGDPGKRLFKEEKTLDLDFWAYTTAEFTLNPEEIKLFPIAHIFGSEELSVYTPAVAERSPKSYIMIGERDAENLGVAEDELLYVTVQGQSFGVCVRIKEELQPGLAGIPYNLSSMRGIGWPAKGILSRTKP
jgi:NADH-quinone oxidoreductase subunit G